MQPEDLRVKLKDSEYWKEYMNQQRKLLLEYFEEHKQRIEDLKTQLKHSRQTVSIRKSPENY